MLRCGSKGHVAIIYKMVGMTERLWSALVKFADNNWYQISIDTTPSIADLGYQATIPVVQSILQSLGYNKIVEDLGMKFKVILCRTQNQIFHA